MRKLKVVTNASPLINLSLLGRLHLLRDLFGWVWVTDAVYQEVVVQGMGRPGASETQTAVESGWLQRASVQHREVVEALLTDLHLGEAETIAMAREQNADGVLMDDRVGRAKAHVMGLRVAGTIGILLLAREAGMELDLRLDLDTLVQRNFRISPELYDALTSRE